MQFFKQLVLRLSLIGMTLVMFFIGLGVAVFATVALLIARIFVTPKSHAELRKKWVERQAKYKNNDKNHTIIDGQYTVLENH